MAGALSERERECVLRTSQEFPISLSILIFGKIEKTNTCQHLYLNFESFHTWENWSNGAKRYAVILISQSEGEQDVEKNKEYDNVLYLNV